MTISGDKKICVNGTMFSFNALLYYPNKYLPLITPFFRSSALNQKENETYEDYLSRLFSACYYRKGLSLEAYTNSRTSASTVVRHRMTRQESEQRASECNSMLNALGINVIKYNAKVSKVLFKNSGNQYRVNNAELDKLIESIKSKPNFKRNKLNVRIGVELEFIGKRGHVEEFSKRIKKLVGEEKYDCLLSYNHNKGDKWVLGIDGSLHYKYENNERGYELTSRILNPSSKKDMNELKMVIDLVKEVFTGYTNNSCGTHVHMSFNTDINNRNEKYELAKYFANSYRKNEINVFDKVVPKRRTGNRSRWCKSAGPGYVSDRYRKINFTNDSRDKSEFHIEFRQLDGTLDYNKIYSWIKLQKLFTELTFQNFKDSSNYENNEVREFIIEEAISDKSFNYNDIESLLKEGKLIA